AALLLFNSAASAAAEISSAGAPAELTIRALSATSLRVTLKPLTFAPALPETPALVEREWPAPSIRLRQIDGVLNYRLGPLYVIIRDQPLMIDVSTRDGRVVQNILFRDDGRVSFRLDDRPVLGLGGGGPAMGENWREEPLEFDRRGRLHEMVPAWHNKAYGSRNPVPLVVGTAGWALFVNAPWVQVDLRDSRRGEFIPWQAPAADARDEASVQGRPPPESMVDGLFDFVIFDAAEPTALMADIARITGHAAMPPKWALGYMQSHRTLKDDEQMIGIVDTFRARKLPIDAVIYLGTGFAPRGWNTEQPSYDFNPEVFTRPAEAVIEDLHRRHVKV
ncbi:MAG: TIM-barrel domain-containing protein, partial [Planctomycetaceae bacterium]